jgi:hypothetical protein
VSDITALIPIHRTDGNREWLQQAVNSLGPNVTPLILENDGEVTEALDVGLREATTEFVLPFGADDVAAPGFVDELAAAAWDADVAYPEMMLVDETLTELLGTHRAQPFCRYRLLQNNYITGNSLIRRTAALDAGGYRRLDALEDWDLFVRMAGNGARFKPVYTARMFYRQVGGSRNRGDRDWDTLRRQIIGDTDPTADLPATFYFTHTPATAYLRCQMPAKHLPALAVDGLEAAVNNDGGFDMPNHRGAAIFQLAADRTRAFFTEQLQAAGHRVLVETDDNYLAGGAKRFRKWANWGVGIGESAHTVQGHKWIVAHADGVIVTTEYLASQYRKLNPNVYVCPNQVDPDDWPELAKPDDGILRIGWFASASHAGDEQLIRRAMEWASRQKDVEVVTLGYRPRWDFRFRALPWATDLSSYRRAIQYLDIGVAPVIPTPFTRGRSDLKWLEMSMGGAASVVSDTDPYSTVPDGLAVRAEDAAGFYKAVRRLVQNRDEVKQLAAAAREHVLKERTITANLWRWRQAIEGA